MQARCLQVSQANHGCFKRLLVHRSLGSHILCLLPSDAATLNDSPGKLDVLSGGFKRGRKLRLVFRLPRQIAVARGIPGGHRPQRHCVGTKHHFEPTLLTDAKPASRIGHKFKAAANASARKRLVCGNQLRPACLQALHLCNGFKVWGFGWRHAPFPPSLPEGVVFGVASQITRNGREDSVDFCSGPLACQLLPNRINHLVQWFHLNGVWLLFIWLCVVQFLCIRLFFLRLLL